MSQIFSNHRLLIGTGSMILFGAAVYEHGIRQSKDSGFHFRDDDPTLRRVEKDVVIPKLMRDQARLVDCAEEVKIFHSCVNKYKKGYERYLTFINCKPESNAMLKCMNELFVDYDYYLKCKAMFVKEKRLFDLTKMEKKDRNTIKNYVTSGEKPQLELDSNAAEYYKNVKNVYEKTKDIDKFDDTLLET